VIFLDTNVVSETVRIEPDPTVLRWLSANEQQFFLSTVVLAEVAFGIERIRPEERAKRLHDFVKTLRERYLGRIYSFDEECAVIYGKIMGENQRAGRTLSTPDGMIAAIALRHNATLATRNVRDFETLKLKTVNPWAD
jgi:predicted nucleic acid-binding protein